MTRRLLNLLTLLSLLLCAATVAIWIRSHRVGELFMHDAFKDDRLPYVLTSTWFYYPVILALSTAARDAACGGSATHGGGAWPSATGSH